MGYGPWGRKESDTTERLTLANLLSPDLFFFTDSCREDFRFFLLGAIGPHGRLESRGVAPLGQPSGFRETMKMLKL